MKTDQRLSRRIPASGVHHHKQSQWWLAPLSPFLKHVNMRTLALLMFFGVALLNTTDVTDAQTNEPYAVIGNTAMITNRRQETSPVTPLIVLQYMTRVAHTFRAHPSD